MAASANGPIFGKAASHISDVQFRHTRAPDNKTISILFDNFSAAIVPWGPPVAARSLSIVFPLVDIQTDMALAISLRGAAILEAGTNSSFIFRVLGESHVLDPLPDPSGNYQTDLALKLPAASVDLRMTFFITLEQAASPPFGQASLTVDSVELAIS